MQDLAQTHPKQTLVIRPTAGWAAINIRELLQYRDLLFVLARRDLKLRYRQTLIGPIWIVLEPFMAAGIFTFVFGMVAHMSAPKGTPYYLYSFSGLLGWNLFSNVLGRTSGSLIGNTALVAKVYFPRLILPLATVCSVLFDFAASFITMLGLLVAYRIWPGMAILTLPIWLGLMLALGLGVGLCASAIMVTYRDVNRFLGVCTTFLMWASPVAYAIDHPTKLVRTVYILNPIASLLKGLRWSLLGKDPVNFGLAVYGGVFSIVVLAIGILAFRRMERRFADVI